MYIVNNLDYMKHYQKPRDVILHQSNKDIRERPFDIQGGWFFFEKNILAVIFVKKNILSLSLAKTKILALYIRKKSAAIHEPKNVPATQVIFYMIIVSNYNLLCCKSNYLL